MIKKIITVLSIVSIFYFSTIVFAAEVLIDSYSESNTVGYDKNYATDYTYMGQAFKTLNDGNSYNISSAKFYGYKVGSPTGNIYAELFAGTGTYGSTMTGTGSALAVSNPIDISTMSTSPSLITWTFSGVNQYQMLPNTAYVIVVHAPSGSASNYFANAYDNTSPTHSGNRTYTSAGTWYAQSTIDNIFYVYGTLPATGEEYIINFN